MVAFSVDEAMDAAKALGGRAWAVKAQIHAGGRGLGGGVKIAHSVEEVGEYAAKILGMQLITAQTPPEGKKVLKLYIERGVEIARELYLCVLMDRSAEMPVMLASGFGGSRIEETALAMPQEILKVHIDPLIGFKPYHARGLGFGLGLEKDETAAFYNFAKTLYDVFVAKDADLIEINPLVKTASGAFLALDAKISFDDNALFRHPEIAALRDLSEEEPIEALAKIANISYIKLDGNVGCMVNGAGLAMATMDIIKHEGGQPANFLDVGGGADKNTVAKGLEIILKDPNVKAIFVNIFGGIVRCDRVANGIVEAARLINIALPVVIRLNGTNVQEAREILGAANLQNLIVANSLEDGAKKAVLAARGA